MVYDTQLFIVRYSRKLENWICFRPQVRGKVSSLYGTQQTRCFIPYLITETDLFSETFCSLVFRIPDDRQSSKTQ
jgi:hypothetical protein